MGISVIIPAYNAEKFIERCVRSVLTNKSVAEIVVVDDGSKDGTGEAVERLSQKDGRVLVIRQDNSGPSAARKRGLERCTHGIITFVDADDYLEEGAYDKILNAYDFSDVDILEFGWNRVDESGKIISSTSYKKKTVSGKGCAARYIKQKNSSNFLWNKLFKRELFNDVQSLPLFYSEDACLLSQVFLKAKKVQSVPEILYNYVVSATSLVAQPYSPRAFDNITGWTFIREIYSKSRTDLLSAIDLKICSIAILLYARCNDEGERDKYKAIFKAHRKKLSFFKVLANGSFKRKVMVIMFSVSPKTVVKIVNK